MKLKVKFSDMTQANVSTGWQRRVQCVSASNSSPSGADSTSRQWEWQDEHGVWTAYSPAVQRLLEACELCGVGDWQIEVVGRRYKVEVGQGMLQTNLDTNVQRKVRCCGATAGKWYVWLVVNAQVTYFIK